MRLGGGVGVGVGAAGGRRAPQPSAGARRKDVEHPELLVSYILGMQYLQYT